MNPPQNQATPEQAANTLRIILSAMIFPVIGFAAFAMATEGIRQDDNQIMAVLGVFWAAASIVGRFAIPMIIVKNARNSIADKLSDNQLQPDAADQTETDNLAFRDLVGIFQTKTLIAAAILEGAAFLNAFNFWNDGNVMSLVTVGVLVALVLAIIPTKHGIENWTEGEIAAIEQLRRT
jgi:hypothetical protein